MNFNNFFKKRNSQKESKVIHIENDKIIPYKQIQDEKNITCVVITKDETTLEKIIKSITTFHDSHKDMEINVVISSSYQKLHKLSGGIF